ncbi:hypothetical protein [Azotobacter chroococcum]|uniref:Uncharacterized protein n=1 Tax=Azotobacter chroococcum TaxID=353 RepID=A0AAQ0C027_9GAMM|nr:hypothetical protein [Azotobacter chroococcum]QQE89594.1 hypothetical protein GKQ51_04435 [Azotobacter chroococcum]
MYAQSLDVRFEAVRTLQGLLARHLPGSRRYEQVEHAIDLALNESRIADEYLVRNVLRDAQRIRDRFSNNHPCLPLVGGESADELNISDPGERFEQLVDQESPEQIAIADRTVCTMLKKVEGSPLIINRVFEGMVGGVTVSELATATGFSTSYLSKIRMALSASAKAHLAVAEV